MPYFTTDDLRGLPDIDDQERFSDERCEAAHDWIVGVVERECGTSFIPTVVEDERLSGGGLDWLALRHTYVQSVEAVTVDDTAYTSDEVEALLVQDGFLYQPSYGTWPSTARGNVLVSYTHGYSTEPPVDLKEAMMRAARYWLLTQHQWSAADARSTSISNEFGNVQLSVAGRDRPTGLPDVDATIIAWRDRVRVPSVA